MLTPRIPVLMTLAIFAGYLSSSAQEEAKVPEEISYYGDIRVIFQARCHGCHQPAKSAGGYVMTDFARLIGEGESEEKAVVAGDPERSYLVDQIRVEDGEASMPADGDPLTAEEFETIVRWIREGARDDTPASARPRYDMEHPPVYLAPPVITSLDFSPDGEHLAVSGYHEVVLHRADGSGMVARLVGLSERIESAVYSPEGKRLAVTGGSPGRMGEVQVWDVETPELLQSLNVGFDTIYGASWSGDGTQIAFGCPDTTIRAVNAETGEQVLFSGAHNGWVLDTVFSLKSDHLVTVSRDMSMKLIHVPTQRFVDNITSITPGALKGGLNAVDRRPEKEEVATGGADGTPRMYRMYREKARKIGDDFNLIRAFPAMPGRVFDLAFSNDGKQLVAGSSYNSTGEVRVYNVDDGAQTVRVEIQDGGIYAVAFHPDGRTLAAGGFDGRVRIIDAKNGKILKSFFPIEIQKEDVAGDL